MSTVEADATHYMTFPHTIAGHIRDDFEISLFKDGQRITSIPIEVQEVADAVYTFSFNNDGTDFSTWTLIVKDPMEPTLYYIESWEVRKKTVELNIKQVRSRQDSKGAFSKVRD